MFKNLSIKFLALLLAIIFWFFVVSLENAFYKLPDEVQIQVFNQAQDLAISSRLGGVKLSVRASDPTAIKTLTKADFEAYVDLRNMGAGSRKMEVFVTSKNPQVSVVKVEPSEVDVTLEPLREKIVPMKINVVGQPMKGYKVQSIILSEDSVKVSAAESVLKQIWQAKADVQLDGTEDSKVTKNAVIKIYDSGGAPLEGIKLAEDGSVSAVVDIVASESRREVGVKPKFVGALQNGVVSKIEIDPAVVSITGDRNVVDKVSFIETEPIELKDVTQKFEKSVKLNLPAGVSLAAGQKSEINVKVEIENK